MPNHILNLIIRKITFSRANCGPLNAVLGRFSSFVVFSAFFGRLARGPANNSSKLLKIISILQIAEANSIF